MRRPSPLPPPPSSRSPRTSERAPAEPDRMPLAPRRNGAADSVQAITGAEADPAPDAAATAPLETPWHVRDSRREDGSTTVLDDGDDRPSSGGGDGTRTGADGEPARLTARDVWAAARARRRALRREVRRFTARQRRRRRIWIASIAAVLALVLGSLGAAYSPLFSVERITIAGASDLDTAAVEDALSDQLGTPMPLVDESAIKAALIRFPLVESYSLEARPPHELVVRVVERTPVGALQGDAGYTLVDAAGVALSTTPEAPEGHPLLEIEGGLGSPAFDSAGRVYRSLPDELRTQVATLAASTANDVTLTLADGRSVIWGGPSDSGRKAAVIETLMAVRPDASGYDVSSPAAAVVR